MLLPAPQPALVLIQGPAVLKAPTRGDGAAMLAALEQAAASRDARTWKLSREPRKEGGWQFALLPIPHDPLDSEARGAAGLLSALARALACFPKEDIGLRAAWIEGNELILETETASFETSNVLVDVLGGLDSGFTRVHTTGGGPHRDGMVVVQSLRATLGARSETPAELRSLIIALAPRLLPALPPQMPRDRERLQAVTFIGCVQRSQVFFAVCRSADGRVSWLKVGHRFEDAEIMAIDEKGVTLRRWNSSTAATLEIRPYSH